MSDFRSRVLGTIIGTLSRGSFPKREPVAFLYGHVAKEGETPTHTVGGVGYVGVVAPDIEGDFVDVTAYNGSYYSLLAQDTTSGEYYLFISNQPWKYDGSDVFSKCGICDGYHISTNSETGTSVWFHSFSGLMTTVYPSKVKNCDRFIWTSHNIYHADGTTLYMEAIAPIQIYE